MSDDRIAGPHGAGNRRQRRAEAAQSRSNPHNDPRVIYLSDELDPAIAEAAMKHSAATDIVSEDDREWFAANPGRNFRLRPTADVELAVRQCDRPAENSGTATYTIVRQFRPGHRMRLPFKTHTLHRPENFSDNACAVLLAELKDGYPEIAKLIDNADAFAAAAFGGC